MTATGKSDGPEVSLPGWTIQRAKRVMKRTQLSFTIGILDDGIMPA